MKLPVALRAFPGLKNAEEVDPSVWNAESATGRNGILETLWKTLPYNLFTELLDVGRCPPQELWVFSLAVAQKSRKAPRVCRRRLPEEPDAGASLLAAPRLFASTRGACNICNREAIPLRSRRRIPGRCCRRCAAQGGNCARGTGRCLDLA